ncbi:MAG: hypothetical protein WDZ80_01870 [Candidatus Paceibacterota bacterium]
MEELEEIKCPLCKESFKDKRGLTSHARNKHELERDEVFEKMTENEREKKEWKILGGIGAFIIAIFTLGRFK